jgi:hypothetical protein
MSTSISDLPYNPPPKQVQTVELPVRDIPRETIQHTTDVQTTPNYIPPKQQEYIESQPVVYQQSPSKIDKILEEFKIPILLSVLYFIFQLPTIHSFIIRMFPSIVQNGELSTIGFVVKSICFGLSYHIVTFIMDYLNQP